MAARLAPQEGQRPLPLQEKATRNSKRHSGQTTRAKPDYSELRALAEVYGSSVARQKLVEDFASSRRRPGAWWPARRQNPSSVHTHSLLVSVENPSAR
jgi:hypothetical protein